MYINLYNLWIDTLTSVRERQAGLGTQTDYSAEAGDPLPTVFSCSPALIDVWPQSLASLLPLPLLLFWVLLVFLKSKGFFQLHCGVRKTFFPHSKIDISVFFSFLSVTRRWTYYVCYDFIQLLLESNVDYGSDPICKPIKLWKFGNKIWRVWVSKVCTDGGSPSSVLLTLARRKKWQGN